MKTTIILAVLLLTACTAQEPGIVATNYPLFKMAEAVAGEHQKVVMLMKPGTETHDYEPLPSDIQKISRAKLFIYTGEAIEPWAEAIVKDIGGVKTLDASSHSTLIEGDPYDPHLWLDFENDQRIVDAIAQELSLIDPENKENYENNTQIFNEKLRALDEKFNETLRECKRRHIIVNHDSFGYMTARYNLVQVSIFGQTHDQEPTPKEMLVLQQTAKMFEAKAIFVDRTTSQRVAKSIADQVGAEVKVLRSAESERIDQDFIKIMEENLATLSEALECNIQ